MSPRSGVEVVASEWPEPSLNFDPSLWLHLFSAGDDTLKTWDIRSFRKPLNVATGLTSYFPMWVTTLYAEVGKLTITTSTVVTIVCGIWTDYFGLQPLEDHPDLASSRAVSLCRTEEIFKKIIGPIRPRGRESQFMRNKERHSRIWGKKWGCLRKVLQLTEPSKLFYLTYQTTT